MRKSAADRFARMEAIAEELDPFAEAGGEEQETHLPVRVPAPLEAAVAPTLREVATAGPASPPHARLAYVAALGVVVAVGAIVASRLVPLPRGATRLIPDAATAGTESQMSPLAEATTAYRAGLEAEQQASLELAEKQFDRGIALDPEFAAAHLRRALLADVAISDRDAEGPAEQARNGRASLGDHDRALLDAVEPWMSVPPDLTEARRRLEVAASAHPGGSTSPTSSAGRATTRTTSPARRRPSRLWPRRSPASPSLGT